MVSNQLDWNESLFFFQREDAGDGKEGGGEGEPGDDDDVEDDEGAEGGVSGDAGDGGEEDVCILRQSSALRSALCFG